MLPQDLDELWVGDVYKLSAVLHALLIVLGAFVIVATAEAGVKEAALRDENLLFDS